MTDVNAERFRLMKFYQAGLAVYAGDRALCCDRVADIVAADRSNPRYTWFTTGVTDV